MSTIKCILTGDEVPESGDANTIAYNLTFAKKTVEIFICRICKKNISNTHPFHIIKALIVNEKWPKRIYITSNYCGHRPPPVEVEYVKNLSDFVETLPYPKTPSEKMNNLFLNLFKAQKIDGESLMLNAGIQSAWWQNYFQSQQELLFYIHGLVEKDLIKYAGSMFSITHKGLNEAIKLSEEGTYSKNCFIAMAFTEDMLAFRLAIKKALEATGFYAIIIDEEHLESDRTIPDGILAGIKKAKFCIADFTHHRNGVYFESGYAVGLGKPVIYTCRKDEFDKAHFDIKQLQHIIYENAEDLEKSLIAKIEAWIK